MVDAPDKSADRQEAATQAGDASAQPKKAATSAWTSTATSNVTPNYTVTPDKAPEKSSDKKQKPFKSHGYRIHNELTYRAIDWLLNSSVGVATTYWAARTKSGQEIFGKHVGNFFKTILSPIFKDPAVLKEGAKWGTAFTSIMAGGFTIIPLMMLMENKKHKKKMIHWMDEKIYGKDKVANDPKFEESYRKIDEEPKKGFWTGVGARFIAIAPLITLASIPATNKVMMKYIYNPIGKMTKAGAEKLGIKPGKMAIEGAMEHLDGNPKTPKQFQSNWDFLHQTIGFDFGLTIFYALLHEASYKALSANREKRHKAHAAKEAAKHHASVLQPVTAPEKSSSMRVDETGALKTEAPVKEAAAEPTASTPEKSATTWVDKNGALKTARPEKAENYVVGVDKSRLGAEQPSLS